MMLGVWTGFFQSELPKSAIGAVGFLLALVINVLIERHRQRKTFDSLLAAIRAEAAANCTVLTDGYSELYPSGVVFREFRVTTAQAMLASPTFMAYLDRDEFTSINQYVSVLPLANSYRRVWESRYLDAAESDRWFIQTIGNHLLKVAEATKMTLSIRQTNKPPAVLSPKLKAAIKRLITKRITNDRPDRPMT